MKRVLETQPFHWVTFSGKGISSHLHRGGWALLSSMGGHLLNFGWLAWGKSLAELFLKTMRTFPWLYLELGQSPKRVNTSAVTFSVAQPIVPELHPIHWVQWDHPGAKVLPEIRKCFTVCLAMEVRPGVKWGPPCFARLCRVKETLALPT